MDATHETKKPRCKLTGTDGNVFSVIATVSRSLKRSGQEARAAEWATRAMNSRSYDAALALAFEYVEVS